MVITDESETVREEDLREVQDHQEKRQDHGHLREPQAQAETGLRSPDPPKIVFSENARPCEDGTKSHREVKRKWLV